MIIPLKKEILPVWQPLGYSTYQITNTIAAKYGLKAAHTGVLDPLARGVIIVLLGDERLNKIQYSKWKKTYEFDLTFGLSTDSYDGMGLVTGVDFSSECTKGDLKKRLNDFIGKYKQQVPLYSAKKVKGKKLFLYPKEGLLIPELPTKKGEIYSIELIELRKTLLKPLINKIIAKVKKIKNGEYRQLEIVNKWEILQRDINTSQKVLTAKIKVQTSSGIYVRSLSQDIASKIGTVGFVTDLTRTKNGDYSKNECRSLEDIFGTDFNHDDLVSKFKNKSS